MVGWAGEGGDVFVDKNISLEIIAQSPFNPPRGLEPRRTGQSTEEK